MTTHKILHFFGTLALCLGVMPSLAQSDYPAKPIRFVVPLAAGGGVDLMARITAQRLSDQLGEQVVVVNQPGAGGTIAGAAVARTAPDGYTFLFQSMSSAVVNAVVYTGLNYDPVNDYSAVTLVARFPLVLVVNPQIPAKDLKEFIALLKANPGKYSYGSSGVGTIVHLAGELFKSLAQVDMLHVPYKGNAAVVADLFAGRVAMMIDGVPPQVKNISAGKVRPLAVTTTTRSEVLPNVPTMKESGIADYEIAFWVGLFAPAKTPKAFIDRIASETAIAMKHPDTMKRMKDLGSEGVGSTPEALDHFWRQELSRYGKIVKDSGIKLEQ
jgi:tripartite-type tricarboxylate transporter receptor subunit TctC